MDASHTARRFVAWTFAVAALTTFPSLATAQRSSGTVIVSVTADGRALAGATVASGGTQARSDRSGIASLTLPIGLRPLVVTSLGFAPESLSVTVRLDTLRVSVALHQGAVALTGVVVATTRNERRVADEPTRVEITDRGDVEEQVGGSPGVIAELLTESGGVRVQRTSAGSSGTTVRIRGMRGRYTKILSDGLPLFGVTTEGLGPLQIPPIDLERVEVIKGVASALYGPTALGGVVNLVSERPGSQSELVVNQTSRRGTDGVIWKTDSLSPRWGYTFVGGAHYQDRRDDDADGWADLNGYTRFVARPRLFWTGANGNSWFATGGFTNETRTGGLVGTARLPNGAAYRDDADTRRADAGSVGRFFVDPATLVSVRGSTTEEWRTRWYGATRERDRRNALFGEASLTMTRGAQVVVAGAAVERDDYTGVDVRTHDYTYTAPGLFAEHTWSPAEWVGVSSSARVDFHSEYGTFLSPRISVLFRPAPSVSARFSAGTGVFAPTPFTEETEAIGLSHLRPTSLAAERAAGASVDVGGKTGPFEWNASAHRSVVRHPLALRASTGTVADVELVNAVEPTRTGGVELYTRYRIDPVHFTATYTYIDATELDVGRGARREVPLNARHAAGLSGVYEVEHDATVGLELYYTGRQTLADDPYRSVSKPYVTIDALIQKQLGRVIVFLHGEDLNGIRQTQYDPIVRRTPGPGGRWTTDVWAPLEGRVVNFGCRVQY